MDDDRETKVMDIMESVIKCGNFHNKIKKFARILPGKIYLLTYP